MLQVSVAAFQVNVGNGSHQKSNRKHHCVQSNSAELILKSTSNTLIRIAYSSRIAITSSMHAGLLSSSMRARTAIFESRSPVGKAHTSSDSGQNSFTGALYVISNIISDQEIQNLTPEQHELLSQLDLRKMPLMCVVQSFFHAFYLQGAMHARSPVSTPGFILALAPPTIKLNIANMQMC